MPVDDDHLAGSALSAHAATTGVDAAPIQGGRISGTVTGGRYVGVQILDANGFYVDADGAYLSAPLAPGSYLVDATPVPVTAGQTTDHIDATLDGGGRYSVRGLPGGSYRVEFLDPSFRAGNGVSYGTQFYDGAATLAGITPVAVTEGQATTGIDAELRRGGRIEGRGTDAATGEPVADAWVSVYDEAGQCVGGAATSWPRRSPTRPASTGWPCPAGATGQTLSGIDATLAAGGSIRGRITDAGTHAAPWPTTPAGTM